MQVVGGAGGHESQVSTRFESYLLILCLNESMGFAICTGAYFFQKKSGDRLLACDHPLLPSISLAAKR